MRGWIAGRRVVCPRADLRSWLPHEGADLGVLGLGISGSAVGCWFDIITSMCYRILQLLTCGLSEFIALRRQVARLRDAAQSEAQLKEAGSRTLGDERFEMHALHANESGHCF